MGFRACMFNSLYICARILYSDLLDYFLDERSIGDAGEHTREYNSIKKCFGDDSDLPRGLDSLRPTGDSLMVCCSLGNFPSQGNNYLLLS